jgi:hypothetical protein
MRDREIFRKLGTRMEAQALHTPVRKRVKYSAQQQQQTTTTSPQQRNNIALGKSQVSSLYYFSPQVFSRSVKLSVRTSIRTSECVPPPYIYGRYLILSTKELASQMMPHHHGQTHKTMAWNFQLLFFIHSFMSCDVT